MTMDGRKIWWLTALMLCGSAGCMRSGGLSKSAKSGPDGVDAAFAMAAQSKAQTPPPGLGANAPMPTSSASKKPKAQTFVTLGDLRAEMAVDKSLQTAQRDMLLGQAREAYQKALDLESKNLAAQAGIARTYALAGDTERASAMLGKLAAAHPRNAGLWAEWAMLRTRAKDLDGAIACWQKAVALEPKNPAFAKTYGFTLARAGQYEEAYTWLSRAMPEDQAHYNLGRMLYQVHQDAAARTQMAMALQCNPSNEDAREMLASWQSESPQAPANGGIHQAGYQSPLSALPVSSEPVPVSLAGYYETETPTGPWAPRVPPILTTGWDMRPLTVRAAAPTEPRYFDPVPISVGFEPIEPR
jgi:Flp pilus assembly protein TadD